MNVLQRGLDRFLTKSRFVVIEEEKRERQENLLIPTRTLGSPFDSEYGELI
jgi:hypothetical protein